MTAEEFMNQEKYEPDSGISFSDYHGDIAYSTESLMVDFAKYHVKKALESSHRNMQLPEEDLEFILEAYPESNIK